MIFLEIPMKMMNFHVLCEKVGKSWNRTPGWISREAVKVLYFIRFWERYLRPGAEFSRITQFYGNGWNSTTFHENDVIFFEKCRGGICTKICIFQPERGLTDYYKSSLVHGGKIFYLIQIILKTEGLILKVKHLFEQTQNWFYFYAIYRYQMS